MCRSACIAILGVIVLPCLAETPSADELFENLERTYDALGSYEVEYEVVQETGTSEDDRETALMLWRATPGRYYYEPLRAPKPPVNSLGSARFRTVKAVTPDEAHYLLLGFAAGFHPNTDELYTGYVTRGPQPDTLGSGRDDIINPTTLMLPPWRFLKCREAQFGTNWEEMVNGVTRRRYAPYQIRSDRQLVLKGGFPLVCVRVVWPALAESDPQKLILELWLDPAAGWMPRYRSEYMRGHRLVTVEISEFMQVGELWYPRCATRTIHTPGRPEEIQGRYTYQILRFERKEFALRELEVDLSHAAFLTGDGWGEPTKNAPYWEARVRRGGGDFMGFAKPTTASAPASTRSPGAPRR